MPDWIWAAITWLAFLATFGAAVSLKRTRKEWKGIRAESLEIERRVLDMGAPSIILRIRLAGLPEGKDVIFQADAASMHWTAKYRGAGPEPTFAGPDRKIWNEVLTIAPSHGHTGMVIESYPFVDHALLGAYDDQDQAEEGVPV